MGFELRWVALAVLLLAACDGRGPGSGVDGGLPPADGGGSPRDGGPADGGPDLSQCQGILLESDGVLDVDLPRIEVRGNVTLGGAPMPDATGSRGAIIFVHEDGGAVSLALGSSGAASYAVALAPGRYDVIFAGNPSLSSDPARPAIPCNSGPLREDVSLTSDGVLDLDVRAVRVQGQVTLRGAALPEGSRGSIVFGSEAGQLAAPISSSGASRYDVHLLSGRYDVRYAPPACGTGELPCNGGELRAGLELSADGVLDVDLPSVRVRGAVTLAGAAFPDATGSRGAVALVAEDEGRVSDELGSSGPAEYDLYVWPGRYDVRWQAPAALCASPGGTPLPCIDGVLREGVALSGDGVLDIDVPSVRVRGAVTLAGAPMPEVSGTRGRVAFVAEDGARSVAFALPGSGTAGYDVHLLPGTYDVRFEGESSRCLSAGDVRAPIPCNGGVVRSGLAVTSAGVVDLDVRSVRVRGAVTIDGAPVPEGGADRGGVVFESEGGSLAASFGAFGPAVFDVHLLAGSYSVGFRGAGSCGASDGPRIPCNGGVLRPSVRFDADGVLDLDVRAVRVRGSVTVGGAQPGPGARGSLRFRGLEELGAGPSLGLGADGPADYTVTLLAGRYAVEHAPPGACDADAPVPCVSQVVAGCD